MNNYMMTRAWEEIHLDRFKNNVKNIRKHINIGTKLMAVIKADAYGHGVIEIAKCAEKCGADYLGVACIEEAKQLRRHGITLPILILGALWFPFALPTASVSASYTIISPTRGIKFLACFQLYS